MPPLIQVQGLHKTYTTDAKPLEVLKGIDLEIVEGEAVAILGASGAGKSTLLHIMGSLDHPTSGEVHFEGENLFEYSEERLSGFRNHTMGFVFQFHHLLPMLTALENTMLPGMIAGMDEKARRVRAEEVLDQVGLLHRSNHRPAELSGGEQQRVAIARAVFLIPRVLFADEPSGILDSRSGDEVADLLISLRDKSSVTLVIVTHNERLAQRLPRRVLMSDGRVKALHS